MFDIEYKGGNTVILATKKATLAIDPKQSVVGLKDVAVKEAIQLATEERFVVPTDAYQLILEGPGEYEVSDFSIRGIPAVRHLDAEGGPLLSTMYRIEVGGVSVAVLGNIASKLSEDQLEGIGVVDMVIIPVGGGGYTLDATSAASLVRQIEPKVVVPVHYADATLKYEVPQDTLETFTKELGAPIEETAKYKVKSSASIPEVLTTVVVTRS
ncbi:MAG TPA: MBL fold metallo-hydrolase [Candidatus Saccharibacteria bacterium]|nr:MBL fold metallo-hydrolase [Candidatus Saccharibacteria bacterium]